MEGPDKRSGEDRRSCGRDVAVAWIDLNRPPLDTFFIRSPFDRRKDGTLSAAELDRIA